MGVLPSFDSIEKCLIEFPSEDPREKGHWKTLNDLAKRYQHLMGKIWGTSEGGNRVRNVHYLQTSSFFLIPEIIYAAHKIQPDRYMDDQSFLRNFMLSGILIDHAVGLGHYAGGRRTTSLFNRSGGKAPIPENLRKGIADFHKPKELYDEDSSLLAPLPHIAMAYSIYETVRAAEFLAEAVGVELSSDDKRDHYHYFAQIVQKSGFRFPNQREDMESLAQDVDNLSKKTDITTDIVDRLLRFYFGKDKRYHRWSLESDPKINPDLTLDSFRTFLRPHSKNTFEQIVAHKNYSE